MTVQLTSLRNIGPKIAAKLERAGIHSAEDLRRVGPEEAFKRIRGEDSKACICCLYSLKGALSGEDWFKVKRNG